MRPENLPTEAPADGTPAPTPAPIPPHVSAAERHSIIEIQNDDYTALADATAEAIGAGGFFSGVIDYESPRFRSRLTATMIIYRSEADADTITDIVPVWWEFATSGPDGRPTLNDFSFNRLKLLITDNR